MPRWLLRLNLLIFYFLFLFFLLDSISFGCLDVYCGLSLLVGFMYFVMLLTVIVRITTFLIYCFTGLGQYFYKVCRHNCLISPSLVQDTWFGFYVVFDDTNLCYYMFCQVLSNQVDHLVWFEKWNQTNVFMVDSKYLHYLFKRLSLMMH